MNKAVSERNRKIGNVAREALEARNFSPYYVNTKEEARNLSLSLIPEKHVVSWGGSMSIDEIGLLDEVKKKYKVIDRDVAKTIEERKQLMRQALLCDTYLCGSNAISESGEIVNVDGNGNRVSAMLYGPNSVIIVAGVNKIVKTLDDAISRARNIAAPTNAQRFDIKTPCIKTGTCFNCNSDDCICCDIVIMRRCKEKNRIKVIIVGENLGF
ncbi:MAG: lactate utilization protein [Rickettsiales bacterium]|jgi:L-lactate utilization protein LutB|nr:lactate utilization protein [Rickettsiales bacterium]